MLKIIFLKKNISLIYFQIKNTLKNNESYLMSNILCIISVFFFFCNEMTSSK